MTAVPITVPIGEMRLTGTVSEIGNRLVQVALAVFCESLLETLKRFVSASIG